MEENVNFEFKKVEDVAIFKLLESSFDASIAGLVKGELTILLSTGDIQKLVFDLSEIEYCDSSGLSAILLSFRILQSNDGHIRLASPQKSVRTLIEISQLNRVLPIKETVEEAVNELKGI
ncbi:MAG: STAS domain-containing protein [Ignavibacteriae bacterium]|nr:STAS domain-containing protein [Ignavibacteriota bacterium]MCB9206835.1 STAS domain-containing protein [Ignavibacteriales bacterium]MCB9210156.1 STAS domain-containing protein [Ignavibacteriales bacterium]MCB9218459.1 STAS domain-containing protein [Ignavibacteriales bacterium]MCB9259535.1 STAS domain-containing protein [Ignavibacteriales bacterium]